MGHFFGDLGNLRNKTKGTYPQLKITKLPLCGLIYYIPINYLQYPKYFQKKILVINPMAPPSKVT